MAAKTGDTTSTGNRSVTFDGRNFKGGSAKGMTVILSSDSLTGAGGSSPKTSACDIVDEIKTSYRLRDHVNIDAVKKALSQPAVQNKLQTATTAQQVLELLGLNGLLLLADYNHMKANGFVKGHLWPQVLGGPGEDWNLTPMNGSANGLWCSHFEKDVKSNLEELKRYEKSINKKYRMLVKYTVKLSGKMRPWFPNPGAETVEMLKQLPAKAVGATSIEGFIDKAGKSVKPSAQERKQFPNVAAKLTLDL